MYCPVGCFRRRHFWSASSAGADFDYFSWIYTSLSLEFNAKVPSVQRLILDLGVFFK